MSESRSKLRTKLAINAARSRLSRNCCRASYSAACRASCSMRIAVSTRPSMASSPAPMPAASDPDKCTASSSHWRSIASTPWDRAAIGPERSAGCPHAMGNWVDTGRTLRRPASVTGRGQGPGASRASLIRRRAMLTTTCARLPTSWRNRYPFRSQSNADRSSLRLWPSRRSP